MEGTMEQAEQKLNLEGWTYPELRAAKEQIEREMLRVQEVGKAIVREKVMVMADELGVSLATVAAIISDKKPRGRPRLKQNENGVVKG